MADILRLSGICVLGLCAALLLREKNAVFALLCAVAAAVAVVLYILEGSALTAVQTITDAAEQTAFSGYAVILLKALGIAYISAFTAEMCKSAGEGMLASAAVLAGKGELILLSLPLISKLLEIAAELL
ncbi:MAG: hypothetical protein HFE66_06535 [Clostridiales bacterium]|jgi:stage III sporulation protein AD|nr:hypothetical protein [Clostridiales bacterium]